MTARANRSVRMKESPSLMSEKVEVHSNFLSDGRLGRRGIGSPKTMIADTT